MEQVFLKIFNRSITAGWIVLAVVVLRLLLKKAPKTVTVFMWGVVAFRLICPFSLESIWSLVPSVETVPQDILYAETPAIHSGISTLNTMVNPMLEQNFAPNPGDSVNPLQVAAFLVSVVWLAGILLMLLYTGSSYYRVWRKVREAVPFRDNVWICDHVQTPFILGVFHPRIYLPSVMEAGDMEYVIAHEKAHLKRRDHLWKPLGFLLLTVYWFQPLLWGAYLLFCRDIELACDETVIRKIGSESKKPYSEALINCSAPRRSIAACPLAFGEVGVKARIAAVLNYKKPAFWVSITALLICIAVAVCFLTDPATSVDERLQVFIDCAVASHHQSPYSDENYCCLDWKVLGKEKHGKEMSVYLWVLYEEFSDEDGMTLETGAHIPTVITVKKEDGNYELVEYWEPRDGSYYATDIKEKFPTYLWGKALDSQRYIKEQSEKLERMAEEHFAQSASGGTDTRGEDQGKENRGDSAADTLTHTLNEGLIRTYVFQESVSDIYKPSFSLYADGSFSFGFSPESDYLCVGRYKLAEDRLVLRTDDGKYVYCFDRKDEAMVFDAEDSSSEMWMSDIKDGSVFQ